MADYQFLANGQTYVDAIKFYPRNAAGEFIAGVTLSLTGCGSAQVTNVRETTDTNGAQCLLADVVAPTSAMNCTLVANDGGSTCSCPVEFTSNGTAGLSCTGLDQYDINAAGDNPCNIGDTFSGFFTMLDTDGNPFTGNVEASMSNNGSLQSFNGDGAGGVNFSAIAGGEGDITLTIRDPATGVECSFLVKQVLAAVTIDCESLSPTLTDYTIGTDGSLTFTVNDSDGNAITSGLTFTGTGASVIGSSTTGNLWEVDFTPNSTNWSISVTREGQATPCVIPGLASATPVVDCASLSSQLAASYQVGTNGALTFSVNDTAGNPVTNGLSFVGTGVTVNGSSVAGNTWSLDVTPTATSWSVAVSGSGDNSCIINGAATNQTIDCSALDITLGSYTVDSTGAARIKVFDTLGNEITSGLSFGGTDVDIESAVYTNGAWTIQLTPRASTFQVSVGGACSFNGSASASRTLDCTNVTCEVIGGNLIIGEPGKIVVKVTDTAGVAVSDSVTFSIGGATLDSTAYSSTLEGWVLDITPSAATVTGDLLSSGLGDCADFCTVAAAARAVDCENVSCAVISGDLMVGVQNTIAVVVNDNQGNPITSGVALSFDGADVAGTPTYSASINAWVVTLTPTADTVVGSQLASAFGNCTNFCQIDTTTVETCCKPITAFDLPSATVGVEYAGTFQVDEVDTVTMTGLPAGLIYDNATGTISGIVSAAGVSTVTIEYGECELVVPFVTNPASTSTTCCPKLVNVSIPTGVVGDDYAGFANFSGTGARTYAAQGLPPGLQISPTTGQYSGTPTQAGNFVSTLTVTDSRGSCTYSVTFDIDNQAGDTPCPPKITALPILTGVVGSAVSSVVTASSDAGSVTFTPVNLGNGLMLNESGQLSGNITSAGNAQFTITATDPDGRTCSINAVFVGTESGVLAGPDAINSLSLCLCHGRKAIVSMGSTAQIAVEGELPDGMSFSGGALIGTPTREGGYTFKLTPGDGVPIDVMVVVESCGDDCAPKCEPAKTADACDTYYWIKVISCVSINGVEFQNSQDNPSLPMKVDKSQRDFMVSNGWAIDCLGDTLK